MAYAAVVSLVRILDQLLHSDQYPVQYPKPQIESLYGKLRFLQSSLEEIFPVSRSRWSEANDLEIQIRDAVYKAQDIIEMFISSQIRSSESEEIPPHGDPNSTSILLEEIIAKLDPITETAEKMRAQRGDLISEKAPPSKSSFSSRSAMTVGLEEDLHRLMDVLAGVSSRLQVVAITGLPGIGKTTLARNIYDHRFIVERFDVLCWATVSEEYNVQEILRELLYGVEGSMEMRGREYGMERMYRTLKGRRYLIVMDDIWDEIAWDDVKRCFPDDNNRSRIIMTTRNAAVADYCSTKVHVMRPLDQESSWILLRDRVFGDENCPLELEDIGRNIAEKCGGIPLSILVVAGLLSTVIRTVECWKSVEEDVDGVIQESYLEIFSLSYNNLPSRLKACFLYMGAFPKDSEILVSKLIKLWVAEGFLTPPSSPSETLEQVAEQHLKDLIDRNLISIGKFSSDGRAKTCSMQGNLRLFAIEHKFFHTINRYAEEVSDGMESQRRISVHKNILMCTEDVYQRTKSIKLSRTLLYVGPDHHHPLPFCPTFDLLRVLDAFTVYFIKLPDALFELIHLRYLAFTYDEDLPPLMVKLRNLLILIIRQHPKIMLRRASILPVEIWNMPQIRHLLLSESVLPDPCGTQNSVLFENLQSLSNINAACCTKEVLQNMPNLKKLGIWIEAPGALHFYLDQLQLLEALKFSVLKPMLGEKIDFLPKLVFPKTLKKLSLSGCGLPWEDMTIIGQLPCLQVLKLRELAFQGPEWCPMPRELRELKFLLLESLDLEKWDADDSHSYWDADDSHFPKLERLIIRHCYELEEISLDIGCIGRLELIELVDCSPSAVVCARRIREERLELGYEDLQLRIHCSWE